VIDEGEARTAVDAALADWPPPAMPDEQVVVWKVDEHSQAWVVHVATRRWLRTQDFRDWAWPVLTDIRDQELVLRKDVHHGVHGQEEAAASSFVYA
jgi:hypothetical protein